MGGKFINTEHKESIDSLVTGIKEIIKNPYYKYNDKSATPVTYFNQNVEKSTLDTSTKLYYQDVGLASPIYYNIIKDFMLYGLEPISIQMVNDDFGPEASEISGEAIILPNTITPYVGDYFNIDYTEEKLLFKIIDTSPDTLENGANIYKIQYKLESAKLEELLEEQNIADHYHMVINNVGTKLNPIIRDEHYNMIKRLDQTLFNLRLYYKSIFYNSRVQTFIFCHDGCRFYDSYMIEFLKEHDLLNSKDADNEYIYISHALNLPATFPVKYNKSFFTCLEKRDKDNIRAYEHRGISKYIDQPLTIFSTRKEEYFSIEHETNPYNVNDILPCFKDEMITAIENDTILGGENSLYNIIVKFFNKKSISQDDIDALEMIDFYDSIYLFYAIPCILYCIEQYVISMMSTEV